MLMASAANITIIKLLRVFIGVSPFSTLLFSTLLFYHIRTQKRKLYRLDFCYLNNSLQPFFLRKGCYGCIPAIFCYIIFEI